jgi:hypothetical protein
VHASRLQLDIQQREEAASELDDYQLDRLDGR